jgi:predicted dehydrogenase
MTIRIGIAGARGLSTISGFKEFGGCSVEALCDLDEDLLSGQAKKFNIPKTYRVFEDMLGSDIDAVVIATPMQCHVPQALAALEAGKHVMSEVTAGVALDELWWLIEAVEKYKKVYMMAENYCYMQGPLLIKSMVEKGLFGEIYYGEGEYLHELKDLAYYNYGLHTSGKRSWRHYWQLGKRGTFYPTHSIGPVMKWFKGDHIKYVSSFGTGWHTSEEFRQDDTTVTMCRLESGKLVRIRLDCISERPHNLTYYSLQGTKGCYEASRGMGDVDKVWLKGEGSDIDRIWKPLTDYMGHMPERYIKSTDAIGHGGGDLFVVQDFIDAIVNGAEPAVDVYEACEWTAVALLSELSVMNGGKTMEMPVFRKNMTREDMILKI